MKKKTVLLLALASSNLLAANSVTVPKSGAFIGVGGSFNSHTLNQRYDPITGISDVYDASGVLISHGEATGPGVPFNYTQTSFSPDIQAGYFKHFSNESDLLWGVKAKYKLMNLDFTNSNLIIPQYGAFENTGAAPASTTFTGRATVESAQFHVNQELSFVPFIGKSYKNSYFYFGAGASYYNTTTDVYNVIGYADVNGRHMNVSGTAQSFHESQSIWGGVIQAGMTYFVTPTLNVDFNYTYSRTKSADTNLNSTFSSTDGTYNLSGTLAGVISHRITSQSFAVSINQVWS